MAGAYFLGIRDLGHDIDENVAARARASLQDQTFRFVLGKEANHDNKRR